MIGREAANIDCYSTLLDPNGDQTHDLLQLKQF